jgi:DNA-binding CsgD family transcriptional regulator
VTSKARALLADAERALTAGDYHGALDGARAAVDAGGRGDARYLYGVLLYIDDRWVEARREWEAAFRLLRDDGELCTAARAAMWIADMHASQLGHPSAAQGWLERARMLLDRVGPCVEWGYLELACAACDRSDVDDLLASADRALAIALEFGDADLEAHAMADAGLAVVSQGRTKEGFARLDAALAAISTGEVSADVAGICFCSMLTACDRAGDIRRAEEWTRIIEASALDPDGRPRVLGTHCRVAYGSVLCAAGRWPEAEALMLAARGLVDAPNPGHAALTAAHLAGLRIEQGRVDEAADLLAPFEDHVTSCEPLARVHLHRGEVDLAAAVLRRGLSELVGDVLRSGPLLAALVEVELRRGDIDAARSAAADLAELAGCVDIAVVRADAALARGRVMGAAGDHPAAVVAFQEAKGHLADGERPLARGMARLELAEGLAADGDPSGAIVEARSALACFERLGATVARDRASALLRGLGDTGRTRPRTAEDLSGALTRREREVLSLVSQGLSNAAIAERLFISPKTAEHHVGRVLAKLGVRSRAEAAALAVRLAAGSPG